MTLPRSVQIDPEATPFYHCISRCVRRAFLCGKDEQTGRDFGHRRAWIENRLRMLASIFAIDVCAYAVMSNHFHVVLHINTAQLQNWSDAEVVKRWAQLHQLPKCFETADAKFISRMTAELRERLGSISWFMKSINEPLARLANREDGCHGRFWEGRFRSQALLDDSAILKCMAYVDLNPIRAGLAETPEESHYTSIKARIDGRDDVLAPFSGKGEREFRLPIGRQDYFELVDYTGRQLKPGKRGQIAASMPRIVNRLQASSTRSWGDEMLHLSRYYFRAIGDLVSLRAYRDRLGQLRLKGLCA